MDQQKTSARYYLFEDLVWETPAFAELRRIRRLAELQLLAGLVWARERGCGPCPVVRSSRTKSFSDFTSSGKRGKPGAVSLTMEHQSLGGLLHEIAHALGPHDKLTHGPAFRRRCTHLYKMYGGWSGEIDWDKPHG
jgi:hypothetical protein